MSQKLRNLVADSERLHKYQNAIKLLYEAGVDHVLEEALADLARKIPLDDMQGAAQTAAMMSGYAWAIDLLFNLTEARTPPKLPRPNWGASKTNARRLGDAQFDGTT